MSSYATQAYRTQQNTSASPVEVVAILYDRALVSLREAAEAADRKDIERRWKANRTATQIIQHLRGALDVEQGGEVAENLDRLYGYALRRLFDVDMKNDAAAAREVARLLEPLRDSWKQLARQGVRPGQDGPAQGATQPRGYGQDAAATGSFNLST